jgi:tetratricopeptide (TPR) repeat protein
MLRDILSRRMVTLAALVTAVALSVPAFAQSTGMVKGKVVDGAGELVDGAKVVIEFLDGVTRKYETKTNRRGEFIQIGLSSGNYRVTASKDGVGAQAFDVRVRLGQTAEVNFQLVPGGAAEMMSPEEAKKLEAFKKIFEAGVAASNAGDHDGAIASFQEALAADPDCYACQYNIGGSQAAKKDFLAAEEAFKKAIAMRPDSPEPYNALANVYNAERKFDEAAKMTEEAAKRVGAGGAGGDADSLFNQGVIFWNAGKIPDAKKQFEGAVKLNPNMADAHYWLGMALLNEGNLPSAAEHFESYVNLAPDGQYADQAKGVLSQIKK